MYYGRLPDAPGRRFSTMTPPPARPSSARVFADPGPPSTASPTGSQWTPTATSGSRSGAAACSAGSPRTAPRTRCSRFQSRSPPAARFGGPGMGDLYLTRRAGRALTEAELEAQPLAGRLLRLRPGPVGLPRHDRVRRHPPPRHPRGLSAVLQRQTAPVMPRFQSPAERHRVVGLAPVTSTTRPGERQVPRPSAARARAPRYQRGHRLGEPPAPARPVLPVFVSVGKRRQRRLR